MKRTINTKDGECPATKVCPKGFGMLAHAFLLGLVFTVLTMAGAVSPSSAAPIVFTYQGNGSGSMDGVSFDNVPFSISAYGDTNNRKTWEDTAYYIDHGLAVVDIDGIGSFRFLSQTSTFVNYVTSTAGFSLMYSPSMGLDLLYPPSDPIFASWDMRSSVQTISGTGAIAPWPSGEYAVVTDGGALLFDLSYDTYTTFSARIGPSVPVPSSMIILWCGLLGVAALKKNQTVYDSTPIKGRVGIQALPFFAF